MVERLPEITVPSQHPVTNVNQKNIKQPSTNNFETTINSTTEIQKLQEQIDERSKCLLFLKDQVAILTKQIGSGLLKDEVKPQVSDFINKLEICIKSLNSEIERLKTKLEAEKAKDEASQDTITKDETQKSQVLAQNVLALNQQLKK